MDFSADMRSVWSAAIFCAALVVSPPALADLRQVSGPALILEGDLLEVRGETLRLWGVDALEPGQNCYRRTGVWACGAAAVAHLEAFIGTSEVRCLIQDGSSDEVQAKCSMKGLDLSAELANHGFALVPPDGPQDYILNHHDGRTHQAGLWGTVYVPPWEWRQGRRVLEWIMDAKGCSIKGDISEDGNRTYYLPNQPAYDAVRIQTEHNERWFCSAEDADAAGWLAR